MWWSSRAWAPGRSWGSRSRRKGAGAASCRLARDSCKVHSSDNISIVKQGDCYKYNVPLCWGGCGPLWDLPWTVSRVADPRYINTRHNSNGCNYTLHHRHAPALHFHTKGEICTQAEIHYRISLRRYSTRYMWLLVVAWFRVIIQMFTPTTRTFVWTRKVDVDKKLNKFFLLCVKTCHKAMTTDEMSSSGNTISSYRDTTYLAAMDVENYNNWHFIIWSR